MLDNTCVYPGSVTTRPSTHARAHSAARAHTHTHGSLDELFQDETLEAKMTRDEFEKLVDDLLARVRIPVTRYAKSAPSTPTESWKETYANVTRRANEFRRRWKRAMSCRIRE